MKVYAIGPETDYKVIPVKIDAGDWLSREPVWAEKKDSLQIQVLKGATNSQCKNAFFLHQQDAANLKKALIPFRGTNFPQKVQFVG